MDTNETIYIGSVDFPILVFDNHSIGSISCDNSVDVIGNELSSDVLEFEVFFDDEDAVLRSIKYGTDVYYYSGENLVGKYYFNSFKRTGSIVYKVYCTSLIGLVANEECYGNFYDSENFSDVVNDILFRSNYSLRKYQAYAVTNPNGGTLESASMIQSFSFNAKYCYYRMCVDFMVRDITFESGALVSARQYVSGCYYQPNESSDNQYSVYVIGRRETTSSPVSVTVYARYRRTTYECGSFEGIQFGLGTRFYVDMIPEEATVRVRVNYVKYDDPTVTGAASFEGTIDRAPSAAFTNNLCLAVAFGYAYRTSSGLYPQLGFTQGIVFYSYKVYQRQSEGSGLYINAYAVKHMGSNDWYMVNFINGIERSISSSNIAAYGDMLGITGGGITADRDLELYQNIEYADGIDTLQVYGWIDKCTKREALHQLLFAENVSLLKTAYGKILFTAIADADPAEIDELVCYDDSEEQSISTAKLISITENAYEEDNTNVKIFDNTNSPLMTDSYIAVFDQRPIFGTPTGSGVTILEYTANAALITGNGTITGKVYNNSQNVNGYLDLTAQNGTDISVDNIGLITALNSDTVMSKLKAYYCKNVKKVTNSLVFNGEKCGVKYRFKTLYENVNDGFLSKLSARVSSFAKATCTFITGYVPPRVGGYTAFTILTAWSYTESWYVPEEVKAQSNPAIRIVLISRGESGTAGGRGEDGQYASEGTGYQNPGEGGAGGAAGTGGRGGTILSVGLDATNITRVDISSDGTDITAKVFNNASVVSTYSSVNGTRNDNGHINLLNGVVYGRKGADGIPGAAGGRGGGLETGASGERGGDVESYIGGASANSVLTHDQSHYYNSFFGGGGGAAYGQNGVDSSVVSDTNPYVITIAGSGANAGAAREVYTAYGCGGTGGNGGGGGGGAGIRAVWSEYSPDTPPDNCYSQQRGWGGSGSAGGAGIRGCAIIYY